VISSREKAFVTDCSGAEMTYYITTYISQEADVGITIDDQMFEASDLRELAKKLKKLANKLDRLAPTYDDGPF
jgi:hypothetical protein